MQNPMQYSWHGNFHHKAYKLRNIFFSLEKFDNGHVSFDLKYFKTHNKIHLSVNVFCRWVAEFGNLDNKDFQQFNKKKHLIKFEHVNLFQNV